MNKKEQEEQAINSFTILTDTREQLPYRYPNSKTQMLPYGDYTVAYYGKSYIDQIVVDRKGSISELYAFAGSERDRFCRELERMQHVKFKYILIEHTFMDIINKQKQGILPASTVYSTIMSFMIKYGVTPLFFDNRQNARAALYKIFSYFVKYEILGLK